MTAVYFYHHESIKMDENIYVTKTLYCLNHDMKSYNAFLIENEILVQRQTVAIAK